MSGIKKSDEYWIIKPIFDEKGYQRGYEVIKRIPSADVAPVRRAHWIQEEYWSEGIGMGESHGHYYKCSACGKRVKLHDLYLDEYCRKCGAEMYEAKECERKRQEFDDKLAAKNKEWRG